MGDDVRLMLVDDHPLMLMGIASMLSGKGIEIVGTASNGSEALEMVPQLKPDVMMLDIMMLKIIIQFLTCLFIQFLIEKCGNMMMKLIIIFMIFFLLLPHLILTKNYKKL